MKKDWKTILHPHHLWERSRQLFHLIHQATVEFNHDNGLKLSASLSYYTLFSLAPMLIIVLAISSIWLGEDAAQGYLYHQFEGLMGHAGAMQLEELIRNAHKSGDTPMVSALSFITLLFGATGVFVEIQDSINSIWSIRVKPKRNWLKFLQDRLLSFSLIVGLGFVLLVSLALSALLSIVYDYIDQHFGALAWTAWVASNLMNVGIVTLLFATIFKVLPDARLHWRDVSVGAVFTTVLFLGGKWLVNYYLGTSGKISIYGAAGAVVLIILWVYYSSAILYFGAEFTKVYANKYGKKIRPTDYAVFIEKREVLTDHVIMHRSKLETKS